MVIRRIVCTSTGALYYDTSHIIAVCHKLDKVSITLQESQ